MHSIPAVEKIMACYYRMIKVCLSDSLAVEQRCAKQTTFICFMKIWGSRTALFTGVPNIPCSCISGINTVPLPRTLLNTTSVMFLDNCK